TAYRWTRDGLDWLTASEIETSDEKRAGAHGYTPGLDFLGRQVTIIQVQIASNDPAELGSLIDAWKAACAVSTDELVVIRSRAFGVTRRRYGRFRVGGDVDTEHMASGLVIASAQFESLDALTY